MLKYIVAAGTIAVLMTEVLPAVAQTAPAAAPTSKPARTQALDEETITGARTVELPTPPVIPSRFTLPIATKIVQDSSITTNTPITDKMGTPYAAWADAVRACLQQTAQLVRVVGDKEVPFVVGGTEGTVKLNANGKPVCNAQ
ncbi:hypothetical protein [Leptolyngbya sp. FACHB-36]|uniref:hypothetical protein n=1 Tax=Leptolyngbya sp. FACHB-36 TaxID=2692808 RepID=UPI0016812E43|nr:hypothetical protein [Leptolyngbya sp. FACHB-36]